LICSERWDLNWNQFIFFKMEIKSNWCPMIDNSCYFYFLTTTKCLQSLNACIPFPICMFSVTFIGCRLLNAMHLLKVTPLLPTL
jgi:hypothetical protein